MKDEIIGELISRLREGEADERVSAAEQLGDFSNAVAAQALVECLTNEDDDTVKGYAIKSLGKIADPNTVDALIKTLKMPDSVIKSYSAEALGEIGDVKAVPELLELAGDPDEFVRGYIAKALAVFKNNEKVIAALEKALEDQDEYVRGYAALSLAECAQGASFDTLTRLIHDTSDTTRCFAMRALNKADPEKARAIIEPLVKDDSNVVQKLAERLLR